MITFVVVFYCAAMLVYLVNEDDTRVNDTIAFSIATLLGVVVVGYTGFATAQDIAAIMATRSGMPYADPVLPIEEDIGPVPGAGQ